jgi:hypothetical protein
MEVARTLVTSGDLGQGVRGTQPRCPPAAEDPGDQASRHGQHDREQDHVGADRGGQVHRHRVAGRPGAAEGAGSGTPAEAATSAPAATSAEAATAASARAAEAELPGAARRGRAGGLADHRGQLG